ncbi:unnamed protein product [Scytosiphon promiscuus]
MMFPRTGKQECLCVVCVLVLTVPRRWLQAQITISQLQEYALLPLLSSMRSSGSCRCWESFNPLFTIHSAPSPCPHVGGWVFSMWQTDRHDNQAYTLRMRLIIHLEPSFIEVPKSPCVPAASGERSVRIS